MHRMIPAALLAACGWVFAGTGVSAYADSPVAGDPAKGQKVFRKCASCHTVDKGGKAKSGPNLWGVVGADVAASAGYKKYSKALRGHGGQWTPTRLDAFLTKPRKDVPGTRMSFAGLKKEKDRNNLIAYLNLQSDTPFAVAKAAPAEAAATDQEADDFGLFFVDKGVEETFYACTPCHSERIVAQQGLTRADWDELLDWMVEEQDMDEPDAELRTTILDYLSKHYNTDRPNRPKPAG